MKAIAIKGRDGSPQPSQVSGASRRSAPTTPPLRASAPPREFFIRSRRFAAFTLLEVLVATAVLALMLSFLFNLLGSSSKLWEIGNKRMEAAQAARVGLNIIANDLKNAFAGNMTSYTSTGNSTYNIAPFLAVPSSSASITGTLTGDASVAAGSDQLFGVRFVSESSNPYEQFGYQCVFVTTSGGFDNMRDKRYYLVSQNIPDAFYYKSGNTTTAWYNNTRSSTNSPIVDNCIRLKLEYYGNTTSPVGAPDWTIPSGTWPPTDRLPLGILVTISVLDSKTAEKIAAISQGALDSEDIKAGLDAAAGNGTIPVGSSTSDTIKRLIAQGSVTMSRFIPLNPN